MTDQEIRVGIDVGCKAHRVGIANTKGKILEEFDISHTDAGFQEFLRRIDHYKQDLALPVAVAMEGFNGYARPLEVWGLPLYFTGDEPCRSITTKVTSQGKHAVVK